MPKIVMNTNSDGVMCKSSAIASYNARVNLLTLINMLSVDDRILMPKKDEMMMDYNALPISAEFKNDSYQEMIALFVSVENEHVIKYLNEFEERFPEDPGLREIFDVAAIVKVLTMIWYFTLSGELARIVLYPLAINDNPGYNINPEYIILAPAEFNM